MAREEMCEPGPSIQHDSDKMANIAAAILSGDIGYLIRPVTQLISRKTDRSREHKLLPLHQTLHSTVDRDEFEQRQKISSRSISARSRRLKHCLKPKVLSSRTF